MQVTWILAMHICGCPMSSAVTSAGDGDGDGYGYGDGDW